MYLDLRQIEIKNSSHFYAASAYSYVELARGIIELRKNFVERSNIFVELRSVEDKMMMRDNHLRKYIGT